MQHSTLSEANIILRQTEWGLQNGPITKNWVSPVTNLFFRKFCFSLWILCKELNVPITQIFILFEIVWVLFEGTFSLWVSLKKTRLNGYMVKYVIRSTCTLSVQIRYTESKIVLRHLQNGSKKHPLFVANRLMKICSFWKINTLPPLYKTYRNH